MTVAMMAARSWFRLWESTFAVPSLFTLRLLPWSIRDLGAIFAMETALP